MKKIGISCLLLLYCFSGAIAQKQRVWLDADTGNEMDDLYAIVYLLRSDQVEVVGLSSAHFNNPDLLVFEKWNAYPTEGLSSIQESQRLNEEILAAMGRQDLPHPIGADRQIGRAWGGSEPRDSPAAQAIIAAARATPVGQKLDVVTIGALTNIATAVILAPDILPKIRCFSLGASYKPQQKVWNKSEFNIRNDLNAFDYLLNLEGFDFTVMPIDAALPLKFDREDTYNRLNEKQPAQAILENRWREHNPQDKTRIMWDLALVAAYLHPERATLKWVHTPPENTRRKIRAYTQIDAAWLAEDFWKALK